MCVDCHLSFLVLVAGKIIHDDDVTWLEGRSELGFDISLEGCPVHRRIHHPGCDEAIALGARDKSPRSPVAEGRLAVQAFAFQGRPRPRINWAGLMPAAHQIDSERQHRPQ